MLEGAAWPDASRLDQRLMPPMTDGPEFDDGQTIKNNKRVIRWAHYGRLNGGSAEV